MEQILCGLLGILQFFLIAYITIIETKKKSSAVFLWSTLLLMFGVTHLITCFFMDLSYSVDVISQASLFVILFCILYLAIRNKSGLAFIQIKENEKNEINISQFQGSILEYLFLILFVVSIISYLVNVVDGQGGVFYSSWATARQIDSDYISIWGLLIRLVFMLSGLGLYYFLTKRKLYAVIVLLLFVVMVIITRNRVQMIPVLIFPITLFLIKINRIKIKHVLGAGIIGIFVILVVYGVRAFRYLGTLSNAFDNVSWEYLNTQILTFILNQDGELALRQYFYYFIQNDNNFEGFNSGVTYIRMLLVYFPSQFVFGLKPQSFDLFMGQAIGMDVGGSTHPTLFGDCFGNFSWLGVLLGAFWAFYANSIDRLVISQKNDFYKIMLFYLGSYAYIVIGRGSVYNGFEMFAWGALILCLTKKFLGYLSNVRLVRGKSNTLSKYKKD